VKQIVLLLTLPSIVVKNAERPSWQSRTTVEPPEHDSVAVDNSALKVGTGDADRVIVSGGMSVEVLETRLWVIELLLLVTVGCNRVGMNVDDTAVEFAAAGDVCNAFEESNVVVVEFEYGADSGFEVDGTTFVVLDVLSFSQRLDVEFRIKVVGLDVADAVLGGTGIELAREALRAPDQVFASEELLIDQLPGPSDFSPVAVPV
jgi:hypothetical protein